MGRKREKEDIRKKTLRKRRWEENVIKKKVGRRRQKEDIRKKT